MTRDSLSVHPFTNFPFEIVVHICEWAAIIYPDKALQLSLLSSQIRRSILPILVHTIVLMEHPQARAFTMMLKNHPEVCSSVRNLWMTCYDPADLGMPIFLTCRNVERIALQHTFLRFQNEPSHPLNHFQCDELAIFGPSFRHDWEEVAKSTLFGSLKRLRLYDTLSSPSFSGLQIASLSNLTHLALPFHEHIDADNPFLHLEAILHSESLKYIVILLNYRMITPLSARTSVDEWAISARLWDERLYAVFDDLTRVPHLREWEYSARGDGDIWDRAMREREDLNERLRGNHSES
jgi:hypothetical protein